MNKLQQKIFYLHESYSEFKNNNDFSVLNIARGPIHAKVEQTRSQIYYKVMEYCKTNYPNLERFSTLKLGDLGIEVNANGYKRMTKYLSEIKKAIIDKNTSSLGKAYEPYLKKIIDHLYKTLDAREKILKIQSYMRGHLVRNKIKTGQLKASLIIKLALQTENIIAIEDALKKTEKHHNIPIVLALVKEALLLISTTLQPKTSYLNTDSKYQIYSSKACTYAKNKETNEICILWQRSTQKIIVPIEDREFLGKGQYGQVDVKGDHKAIKTFKWGIHDYDKDNKRIKPNIQHKNELSLDQAFMLQKNKIKGFCLGLYKESNESIKYIMPRINKTYESEPRNLTNKLWVDFITELYVLNKNGYAHPDVANCLFHISSQNIMYDGTYHAIDLDERLITEATIMMNQPIQDQWLWLFINSAEDYKELYRDSLDNFYRNNSNQPISNNLDALKEIFPPEIIKIAFPDYIMNN